MTKANNEKIEAALVELLSNLTWAIHPDNPNGAIISAQLKILRRVIYSAYKTLGFTDKELARYNFK